MPFLFSIKVDLSSNYIENQDKSKDFLTQFGVHQLLLGGLILSKIWKIWYNNDIHNQKECAIFAAELITATFKFSMPHPQELIHFKNYRMKEFLPNIEVFEDQEAIRIFELIWGLEIISEILIDYEMYEKVLPLLCLMNYISTDIIKSVPYLIKARLLKSIALWKLGYIHESLQLYFSIIKNKDKVINSKLSYVQNNVPI